MSDSIHPVDGKGVPQMTMTTISHPENETMAQIRTKSLTKVDERQESPQQHHWEHISEPARNGEEFSNHITRLKTLGFVRLAEKLAEKKDPVWVKIVCLEEPILIEQLYDVERLLDVKKGDGELFNFAQGLAFSENPERSSLLGKFILLLNGSSKSAQKHLQKDHLDLSIKWIEKEYRKKIEQFENSLADYSTLLSHIPFQEGKIVLQNKLSLEISKLIVSDSGLVNVGLIKTLSSVLNKEKETILNALHLISSNPQLRENIASAKKSNGNSPGNKVIRAAMSLSPKESCEDVHAVRTIAAALLSQHRQGQDGSCFAAPLAISLLQNNPDKCVDDFKDLLKRSKLTRTINNNTCDFPFLTHVSDHHLQKKIQIDSSGNLESKIKIWDVPAIESAIKAIGEDPKSLSKAALKNIFKEKISPAELTIKTFLQELVVAAEAKDSRGLGKLYLNASYAYEAQQTNPLLAAWGNALASMAEAEESGMVRSAVIGTIRELIKFQLYNHFPQDSEMRKKFNKAIKQELAERIHLQYDPQIADTFGSHDHLSTDGAFVLYDKNHSPNVRSWIRLDNPGSYQSFICRLVEDLKELLPDTAFHQLDTYINSSQFLLDSIKEYYPPNGELVHPLKNFKSINYTPWVTKSGNNLTKVMQVYFQNEKIQPSLFLAAGDAQELLKELIKSCQNFPSAYQSLFKENSKALCPIRIPGVHAFSLLLGDPTFVNAWTEKNHPDVWINQHLESQGHEIANASIDTETRSHIIEEVGKLLIHPQKHELFIEQTKNIPEKAPIKDLRTKLLKYILKIESEYTNSPTQIALQLDALIIKQLPDEYGEKLRKNLIFIGDSNWSENGEDLHFCFLVNPGNEEIELWAATAESKELFPLDQHQWLGNHIWEIFYPL